MNDRVTPEEIRERVKKFMLTKEGLALVLRAIEKSDEESRRISESMRVTPEQLRQEINI